MFRDAPVAMLVAGGDGAVVDANRAWCALSGLSAPASLGDGWLETLTPTDQARVRRLLDEATPDPPHTWVDAPRVGAALAQWGRWTVSRTLPLDSEAPGLLITVADITTDQARITQLHHAATHDPLTGAANRTLFLEAIGHAVARLRRHPGLIGVLFLDLDGFKVINDRWGHVIGDQVLVAQADRLRETVRPADVIARLGGDEFAVLCEDLDGPQQIGTISRRIASRLADPIMTQSGTISVPASVGAVITGAAVSAEHLIDVADRAMYRTKERGGPPEVVVDLGPARQESAVP